MTKAQDDLVRSVTVWAPASLSNLGPGFDSLGVAIEGVGDRVEAFRTRRESSVVIRSGDAKLPTDPRLNTASIAGMKVLQLSGVSGGVRLEIEKGIPFGSGLGGSAACAVAGAVATNALLDNPLGQELLIDAALAGESVASGSAHGDNVLPAMLGGVVLVDARNPERFRQLSSSRELRFAIVVPEIQVETSLARRMLPAQVPFRDAIHNASSLAWLIEAIRTGDFDLLGEMAMRDTIVEPVRAALIPCYRTIKEAALTAGSPGCTLSGSGPAMFAVCRCEAVAAAVLSSMVRACEDAGFRCMSFVAGVDGEGSRIEQGFSG